MKGKILKKFILSTSIWTMAIMAFIVYVPYKLSNIWLLLMTILGLIILWFFINAFITVHFLKKDPK